ncbi:efflux RND transporter periplasmic adaptor subunit [bacterium SCSIO 12696]|nr:efflux RND transporter periplasmic adaptor subunit [bacterium SCSIO 12696]
MAVLAVSAVVVGGLNAFKPEPEKKDDSDRPLSAFVETVKFQPTVLQVQTRGEVQPRTEIDLISEVSGRIQEVSSQFVRGGAITPDTVLIRIDDADYRHAVTRAQARVTAAEVQILQREAEAQVAKTELKGKPHTPLGLKIPQLKNAQAELLAAQADLRQAQENLARTRIRLPFNGRVLEKQAGIGEFVSAGTRLGKVFATDVAEVRLPLTDEQLALLNLPIGYQANNNGPEVRFEAELAGQNHQWYGRLVRIEATIDPQTRLIHGVAEVKAPYSPASASQSGQPFAVGLFVSATIDSKTIEAHVIPSAALHSGNTIYVIENDRLQIREIDVLSHLNNQVIVSDGLEAGERVVISPIKDPINGMLINPVDNLQPASSSPDNSAAGSNGVSAR